MIQIAICDDMPVHISHILILIENYKKKRPGIKLKTNSFNCGAKLLESLNDGKYFDIYMLDILMPDLDGIKLAQQIRSLDIDLPVIFLTQSENYALDAFGVSAVQYLLKPVDTHALYSILDKIIATQSQNLGDNFLTVTCPGRMVSLAYSSITVIEYSGRSLHYYLNTGEIIESKTIRTSFGVAVSDLLTDKRFFSVHQSFVINLWYVREVRSRSILMSNGMDIPVPKLKYTAVKKAYLDYLEEISMRRRKGEGN